jgi:hypothetical protein
MRSLRPPHTLVNAETELGGTLGAERKNYPFGSAKREWPRLPVIHKIWQQINEMIGNDTP